MMIDSLNIKQGGRADIDVIREFTRKSYAKWIPLIDGGIHVHMHKSLAV